MKLRTFSLTAVVLCLCVFTCQSQDSASEEDKIPKGTKSESGLVFDVPFPRGVGNLTLSRQNDCLRLDAFVWAPFEPTQDVGSSSAVEVYLSVDGKNGRQLRFVPFLLQGLPRFAPSCEVRAYSETHPPNSKLDEIAFAGRADVRQSDRWNATLFIKPGEFALAGNEGEVPADSWRIALRCTGSAATVFPVGFNAEDPARTPDKMISFKLSDLPKREAEKTDPFEACIGREQSLRDAFTKLSGLYDKRDFTGAFKELSLLNKKWPDELFILNWRWSTGRALIKEGKLEERLSAFFRDAVEACPSYLPWHFELLGALLDEKGDAQGHYEKLARSPLVRGDRVLEQEVRVDWIMLLIGHGMIKEAGQYLGDLLEVPGLAKESEGFTSLQKAHWAYVGLLLQNADLEGARAHYNKIHTSMFSSGWLDAARWSDELANIGRYSEAAAVLAELVSDPEISKEGRENMRSNRADLHGHACEFSEAIAQMEGLIADSSDENQRKARESRRDAFKKCKELYTRELEARVADAKKKNPRLEFETNKGRFVIELYEDEAPNTVANYVKLAQERFYDGLKFYRWESSGIKLIQGGAPKDDPTDSLPFTFKHEQNSRCYFPGTIGVARMQEKDTGSSHFFITTGINESMLPWNGEYTAFGRVVEGMDVVFRLRVYDKMNTVRATNLRDHEYNPERAPVK